MEVATGASIMNLKEIARRRVITQMVRRVRQSSLNNLTGYSQDAVGDRKYCAMIVDTKSLRILSACCKVYDILEEGVTVVEDITKQRQPLPGLDAIYFLSPEASSVEFLCKDFMDEDAPQYRSAHVFFTQPLVACYPGLLSRIQSFVEFNMDFIAYERRVFHFDSPNIIPTIFPNCPQNFLRQVVDELFTLCVSFGDKPNIRFHSNAFQLNEQIAALLHQKLVHTDIPGLTRGKTNLLIVDRSIDVCALLLHEYTYQAYLYDLLDVPTCSPPQNAKNLVINSNESGEKGLLDDTVDYVVTTNEGKQERRVALLGEQDDVYVRYRHQHLMVALKRIPEEIRAFLSQNAAAKLSQNPNMSNDELQRAIRDLPEYQEMLAKFTIHNSISQRCASEFNRLNLQKVGALEQELATGVDSNGKPVSVKRCLSTLGMLMSDYSVGVEEKLRLLLLYFAMTDGVKEEEKRKMIEAAQLSLESSTCIQNFLKLKFDIALPDGSASAGSHTHKLHRDTERLEFFSSRAKTIDVPLSRFQPYLKDVMEKAIQGRLHGGKFPYVSQPETKRGRIDTTTLSDTRALGSGSSNAVVVHARNRDWDFGDPQQGEEAPASQQDVFEDLPQPTSHFINVMPVAAETSSTKLIVFVLGGVMHSEMRAAYEVSRQLGCDVFIGGSTLLTPRSFLEQLKSPTTAAYTA